MLGSYRYKKVICFLWLSLFVWSPILADLTTTPGPLSSPKCFDITEGMPKKYPFYLNQQAEITVEYSNRPLHRLITEIFKIFLEEILGFERIRAVYEDDNFNLQKIIHRLQPGASENITFPSSMINLQVWIPIFEDTIQIEDSYMVKDCGNVIPAGRFGWFVPRVLDKPLRNYYKNTGDLQRFEWTLLRNQKLVEAFDVQDEMDYVKRNTYVNNDTKRYICQEEFCNEGFYTPPQCNSASCALLLAAEYSNSTKFVKEHIDELKLYVRVVWLGDNLKKVINYLTEKYRKTSDKSILIFHWTPSEVILRENHYVSMNWPLCEILNSSRSIGCDYELHRLVKFVWGKIETIDRTLFHATRMFKFDENEYDKLLSLYENRKSDDLRDIACTFMKTNTDSWNMWKAGSQGNTIYIGGIFPITGSSYNGAGIVQGARLGVMAINSNKSVLPYHDLHLIVNDGGCRADKVMKLFIDYIVDGYYNNLIGVLGPACSETVEPLAGVSKHYHTMIISYSAEGASFSDRHKYPYFFRTIGENKHYKHVYLELFKKFKWTRVAALTEDGQKYTEYISFMEELLEHNGIKFIANTKFPREKNTYQMSRYLDDLNRKRARIIILDVYDEIARIVMCEAYKMKMTAYEGYVWFLPSWLNKTWWDTDYFNSRKESVNCTTAEMLHAATGYLSITHAHFAPDDAIIPENITVKDWRRKYEAKSIQNGISPYAGYAYDAVWTYALALDKLIKTDPEAVSEIHSENTTNKLVKIIMDTDFYGVSGRIKFRGGPSRFSVINILQWYNNQSYIVGHFNPNLTEDKPEILGGDLHLDMTLLKWFTPGHQVPKDGTPPAPQCVLDGFAKLFNVDCTTSIVLVNILLIVFVFLICVGVIYYLKKRYDKKVMFTQKYMRHLGIDLLATNVEDLNKWEVPRSAVVINRKLGEGAFGMVYAGDANIPGKGWTAVAVKTLKVGSTTEEKLDFLSEAEVMKRFDHKNIVQLLGVVTVDEPIFTIMEFMLYGDLKTYLLARRHLVNENVEESEEVNSKRLTQMALDVARGLSYLAELKYVHRDVASRNCLVNVQRVVKLGDFGMTRPMFENDYYKFTRKGMLPVRWMAPESLGLGLFTPASDVWSYGVLLYEIITFGSFPYQAMSNAEVLEYVKTGNTITLPQGIKPQLKALMKSCWNQDPKLRTRASEIVEFLANNPRLLAPCLDIGLTSIYQDHNQFEINLPDQFRKCSASDIKTSPSQNNGGLIPNGGPSPSYSFDCKTQSLKPTAYDSGVCVSMEPYCPKQPLLGSAKSNSSLHALGKYVTVGSSNSKRNNENIDDEEHEDDYLDHNPIAISTV